jgi:hypothetical protein
VIGAAYERTQFGFRKHPYGARHTLRAGYSTTIGTGGLEYEFDSLRTDDRTRFHALARASALRLIHYYGFGNETTDDAPQDVFDVKQTQYRLAPSYRFDLATVDVSIGPVLKYADTHDSPATLLSLDQPYGAGRFGQLGARLGVRLDRRSLRAGRMTGALLSVEGTVYPAVWSVSETFGSLRAEGVSYVRAPLPLEPRRAASRGEAFGRYPFHEAATMGGGEAPWAAR